MDRDTQLVFSAIETQLRRIAYALEFSVSDSYVPRAPICSKCGCTLVPKEMVRCPVCNVLIEG
jgi:hypothetical protein